MSDSELKFFNPNIIIPKEDKKYFDIYFKLEFDEYKNSVEYNSKFHPIDKKIAQIKNTFIHSKVEIINLIDIQSDYDNGKYSSKKKFKQDVLDASEKKFNSVSKWLSLWSNCVKNNLYKTDID